MDVPGQDLFGGNIGKDLRAAVVLVNGLSGDFCRGRPRVQGAPAAEVGRMALRVGHYDRRDITPDEEPALRAVAGQLREVFTALAVADLAAAAAVLNSMLVRHAVRLQLTNHDGRPWHMHYYDAGRPGAADVLGAGCAAALAVAIDAQAHTRLGVCAAGDCDEVSIDTTRNGSRRFCSDGCRNRTKTRALRARAARAG